MAHLIGWINRHIVSGLIRKTSEIKLPHIFMVNSKGYKAFFTMQYFPLRHFKVPYHCSQAVLMTATCLSLEDLGIAYDEPPMGWKWTDGCGEDFGELQQKCEH